MAKEEKVKRLKRTIAGGVSFLTRDKRIIDEEKIKSILPHGDSKRFLDRVTITAKKIIGEVTVRPEHCQGHEIGGQPLLRGVDYPEMAAQLLGIWVAQQAIQRPVLNGKLASLRKASFKCIAPCLPGDLLRAEMPIIEPNEKEEEEGSPRIEGIGREDKPGRRRYQAIGLNIEVWVGDIKRAVVYFIELSIVDAPKLS